MTTFVLDTGALIALDRGDVGVVTSDRNDIGPLLDALDADARIVDV